MSATTITVDLDAIKNFIKKTSKENCGLEDSSGVTPKELEQAWGGLCDTLGPEGEPIRDLMWEIIQTMCNAHDEDVVDESNDE